MLNILKVCNEIITSANEVMFSSAFACLFVC